MRFALEYDLAHREFTPEEEGELEHLFKMLMSFRITRMPDPPKIVMRVERRNKK